MMPGSLSAEKASGSAVVTCPLKPSRPPRGAKSATSTPDCGSSDACAVHVRAPLASKPRMTTAVASLATLISHGGVSGASGSANRPARSHSHSARSASLSPVARMSAVIDGRRHGSRRSSCLMKPGR